MGHGLAVAHVTTVGGRVERRHLPTDSVHCAQVNPGRSDYVPTSQAKAASPTATFGITMKQETEGTTTRFWAIEPDGRSRIGQEFDGCPLDRRRRDRSQRYAQLGYRRRQPVARGDLPARTYFCVQHGRRATHEGDQPGRRDSQRPAADHRQKPNATRSLPTCATIRGQIDDVQNRPR